ncbi:hypothetical protein F383_31622 [Gossypium arboreum]|nr:hypothetical protein F383_31622 [Gossypium arboreum]
MPSGSQAQAEVQRLRV